MLLQGKFDSFYSVKAMLLQGSLIAFTIQEKSHC